MLFPSLNSKLTNSFFVASSCLVNISAQKKVDLVNKAKTARKCNLFYRNSWFRVACKYVIFNL